MKKEGNYKKLIAVIITLALFVLSFFVLKPYIGALLFGALLAYIFYKPYKLLKLKLQPSFAAALLCVVVIVGIALIAYFVIQITIREAFELYFSVQKLNVFDAISVLLSKIFPASPELVRQITTTLQQSLTSITTSFIQWLGKLLINVPQFLLQLFIAFFAMFYFLKTGPECVEWMKEVLPFQKKVRENFIAHSNELTFAIVYGQIVVGLIQGLVAGILFYVFKAPSPLLFTILAVFCGILPIVGPWLVLIPVGLLMIASNKFMPGLLLMTIGVTVSGVLGTLLRGIIVGKRGRLNPVLALVSMLGGLALIGPIGLVIGPLVCAYVVILIEVYKEKNVAQD